MIEVTERQGVAVLRIAHGKANALDLELCRDLTAQLGTIRTSSAGAVVIIGTGKIFSAGVDLVRLLREGDDYLRAFMPALSAMFETIFFYPRPVVAAVNGHAIAGGCVLACAADRRVMARDCGRIGVTELIVGLPFPTTVMEILRATIAPQHLQELVYTGATLSPEDARVPGLIDQVVAAEELLDRALAMAEALASIPAPAFELTKRQIRQPVWERLQATRPRFDPGIDAIWSNAETREAVKSYMSRTFKKPGG